MLLTPYLLLIISSCSSTIIQNVFCHSQNDPSRAIAYYYFDFNDIRKQCHGGFIRSVVTQISARFQYVPEVLSTLYSASQAGQKQPTSEALLTTLRNMLEHFSHTYIIIDALDECKEREQLLAMMKEIFGWKFGLHILITSRKEGDIESSLGPLFTNRLCIQNAIVDADIRTHVQERLLNDAKLKKWPANVREEIETTLMSGAHGMYSGIPYFHIKND
jgi:hypothetical protein